MKPENNNFINVFVDLVVGAKFDTILRNVDSMIERNNEARKRVQDAIKLGEEATRKYNADRK